jgi:hypothetical protein
MLRSLPRQVCAIAWWLAVPFSSGLAQWNSVLGCAPGPCINGVPCRHCTGAWRTEDGGQYSLVSSDAGSVSGTFRNFVSQCGQQITWQVSGTLTRVNPPNTFTYANATIALSATSPSPICFEAVPYTENVILQNDGCDRASGTWQNSIGSSGSAIWTRPVVRPTSETTRGVGWSSVWPTIHQFRQVLYGSESFDGRQVKEVQGFDVSDSCYFNGSPVVRYRLSGGSWPIGVYATPPFFQLTDHWIDDYVGMVPSAVQIYRDAGQAPCDYYSQQLMNIFGVGRSGLMYNYKVGYVGGGIRATEVYSFRDSVYEYRSY